MIDKITQEQISVLLLLAKKANPNINLGAWAKWIDYSTFYCYICNNYIKNTNGNAANHGVEHLKEKKLLAFT